MVNTFKMYSSFYVAPQCNRPLKYYESQDEPISNPELQCKNIMVSHCCTIYLWLSCSVDMSHLIYSIPLYTTNLSSFVSTCCWLAYEILAEDSNAYSHNFNVTPIFLNLSSSSFFFPKHIEWWLNMMMCRYINTLIDWYYVMHRICWNKGLCKK